jgi:hypothetical protein
MVASCYKLAPAEDTKTGFIPEGRLMKKKPPFIRISSPYPLKETLAKQKQILLPIECYRDKSSGCSNDDLLFERSASLNRLDSFAYFSHQGEK